MRLLVPVLTITVVLVGMNAALADNCRIGNLGYNSYEGYLSNGNGLSNHFGPGVGYSVPSGSFGDYMNAGDYFRRYIPRDQWGTYGYGTGHLGLGYGPYIFAPREGGPPRTLNDPLPGAYMAAPPPKIRVGRGQIKVSMPAKIPGVQKVTVTVLAFNGAELSTICLQQPPYNFVFPVLDGSQNGRVRIDYANNGLSSTAYPL
jgi:hypothetical protein